MRLVAAALSVALLLHAQSAAFDAASIKPSNSPNGVPRLQMMPGRVSARNVTGRRIIQDAYDLTGYQFTGGPGWLSSDRFDLEAKSEAPANASQLRQMLQALLAERFKLVAHRESREMPVYALTVAKNGPKFAEAIPASAGAADAPSGPAGRRGGSGTGSHLVDRLDMPHFADMLSANPAISRPVLDKTGLDGVYTIRLVWDSDDDFMAAVEEQLGLKFASLKAPMDILIVDHIEKPASN